MAGQKKCVATVSIAPAIASPVETSISPTNSHMRSSPSDSFVIGITDSFKTLAIALLNPAMRELQVGLDKHAQSNRRRMAYYERSKRLDDSQQTPVVPPAYWTLEMSLGWCGKAVDLLARRCRLIDIEVTNFNLAETPQWRSLRRRFVAAVKDAIQGSMVTGVAWLKISAATPSEQTSGIPALVGAISGLDGTGWMNPRTRLLDAFFQVQARGELNQPVEWSLYLAPSLTGNQGLMLHVERGENGGWVILADSTTISEVPVVPFMFSPDVDHPFGQPRISKPMMSLQNAAVRALTRGEGHMDVYSYPETFLLGAAEELFTNPDGSISTAAQVMLGRVKAIPDNAELPDALARVDVKRFNAASPESHLAWMNMLAKLFCREASLPDTALAITDMANPTSAEAYDASQYELIADAQGITDDYSEPVARAAELLLRTAGVELPENAEVLPIWCDPRFLSRSASADAGVKQLSAAPWLADTRIGLELLGLTPTQIDVAWSERDGAEVRRLADEIAALPALPENPFIGLTLEEIRRGETVGVDVGAVD